MSKLRHQVIPRTTCLVFNQKGEVLLIKFSHEKGEMAGFHDPPGGHIELEEGIVANANREIWEETNLKVSNTKLRGVIHVTNFFGKNLMLFITTSQAQTTNVKPSSEGEPVWVDPKNLDEVKIFDDLKLIIQKIKSLPENAVFTARSEFDDIGKMVKWEVE